MAKSVQKTNAPAKSSRGGYVDPGWPSHAHGEHPVTEIVSHIAGASSPYGTDFGLPRPWQETGYVHPVTNVNRPLG